MNKKLTYKQTGVDYETMDVLKRMAQIEGRRTIKNLKTSRMSELPESRGESAYVIDAGNHYLSIVMEGLGTKSLVADTVYSITGKTYYDHLAQDTVACIVNDLITVGAKPLTVAAYWAAGSSSWFENENRLADLTRGWADACNMSGASWGGGETPTLSGIIDPKTIDLGGAAVGIVKPKKRLTVGKNLDSGDGIIFFESSGIHANGLSLARSLAKKLPDGYKTIIGDGRMYGEALLDPTIIYAKLVQDLFKNNIHIHYMVNITGHGWRKLMRSEKHLTYSIHTIPPVPPVLQFIVENGPVDLTEAYANFNMGAGFAIFVPQKEIKEVLRIAKKNKIKAYHAGEVMKGPKQVTIEELAITYKADSLQVKA